MPPCDSIGQLLRAAADGEPLSDADVERLAQHLSCTPDDRGRLDFERGLRGACRKAMETCPKGHRLCCSEALRERVARIAAESRSEGAVPTGAPAPVGVEARAAETRSPAFWRTTPGLFFGAAAAVLLLTLGVLFWQSGPRPIEPTDLTYVAYRDEVASFVVGEHGHCQRDPAHVEEKFVWKSPDEVREHVAEVVGKPVELPALDLPARALVLKGGGRCGVPGNVGRSVHIRLELPAEGGHPATVMSVFVCGDAGGMPMEPGVTYLLDAPVDGPRAGGGKLGEVLAWVEDGVVFYLVAPEAERTRAAERFGRDMRTGPVRL